MNDVLSKMDILELSMGGRHCSQIVAGQWAEDLDLDEETFIKVVSPFGGGGFHGEMCGAVLGALAVIGAAYGASELGDDEQDQIMIEKTREFNRRFEEKFGTVVCRDLLKEYGLDYAREGELIRSKETNASVEVCSECVKEALEILEDIIEL